MCGRWCGFLYVLDIRELLYAVNENNFRWTVSEFRFWVPTGEFGYVSVVVLSMGRNFKVASCGNCFVLIILRAMI